MLRGGGSRLTLALLLAAGLAGCGATSRSGGSGGSSGTGSSGNSNSSGGSGSSVAEAQGGDAAEAMSGSAGAAGANAATECPAPLQVRHGAECSLIGPCPSEDTFVVDLQASCECSDSHWQCTWPECPSLCLSYGPTCPTGAFPAGCTCTPTPPPPNQNVGGCCCTQTP